MSVNGGTTITPRLGTIVRYTLSEYDVRRIIDNRRNAGWANARGNDPREGDTYPALIVRDWASPEHLDAAREGKINLADGTPVTLEQVITGTSVNIQVFLDGNDTFWATSTSKFDPSVHGRYNLPEGVAGPNDAGAGDTDYSQFWESDPRGHWTDEPVTW